MANQITYLGVVSLAFKALGLISAASLDIAAVGAGEEIQLPSFNAYINKESYTVTVNIGKAGPQSYQQNQVPLASSLLGDSSAPALGSLGVVLNIMTTFENIVEELSGVNPGVAYTTPAFDITIHGSKYALSITVTEIVPATTQATPTVQTTAPAVTQDISSPLI
jgi:hypothetical protein